MSSGGPGSVPALPGGYAPGDRVRIRQGLFARMAGVVLGPAPDCPVQPVVLVRLRIWERDVDVGLGTNQVEPAPAS